MENMIEWKCPKCNETNEESQSIMYLGCVVCSECGAFFDIEVDDNGNITEIEEF